MAVPVMCEIVEPESIKHFGVLGCTLRSQPELAKPKNNEYALTSESSTSQTWFLCQPVSRHKMRGHTRYFGLSVVQRTFLYWARRYTPSKQVHQDVESGDCRRSL